MSSKLRKKAKHKLSVFFQPQNHQNHSASSAQPPRANSMPASTSLESKPLVIRSNTMTSPAIHHGTSRNPPMTRPRTLSLPTSVTPPPPARVRMPRRPSNASAAPAPAPIFLRANERSRKEKKHADEARAVTEESQQCRAELRLHGIVVRDFQAEADNVKRTSQNTGSVSKSSESDSTHTHPASESEYESDDEEVLMMGRKHIDTGRRADLSKG
jgi:hypothetical protein